MAYNRDYMERMLALLSKALGRLLALKEDGKDEKIKKEINDLIKEHLDMKVNDILRITNEELLHHLEELKKFRPAEIELFADIITQYAEAEEKTDALKAKTLYEKILLFYEFVSKKEKSYSFLREDKVVMLREKIAGYPDE